MTDSLTVKTVLAAALFMGFAGRGPSAAETPREMGARSREEGRHT